MGNFTSKLSVYPVNHAPIELVKHMGHISQLRRTLGDRGDDVLQFAVAQQSLFIANASLLVR